MDVLAEKVRALHERVAEMHAEQKATDQEFKDYRHAIRGEIQAILIDIDRITQDRTIRGKELDETVAKVRALEALQAQATGGISVVKWLWSGIAALALIVAAWALGKYSP